MSRPELATQSNIRVIGELGRHGGVRCHFPKFLDWVYLVHVALQRLQATVSSYRYQVSIPY